MRTEAPLGSEIRFVDEDGQLVESALGEIDLGRLERARPFRQFASHRRQRSYTGLFWSSTTLGHVPYESLLERERLWLADFESSVIGIVAQPFSLLGRDAGASRRHVPDFLLSNRDGSFLVVDVKPAEMARESEVRALHDWTARVLRSRSIGHEVWSGADATLLANVHALGVARRWQGDRWRDLALLQQGEATTIGAALSLLPRPALLALLWHGEISADLSRPLSATTEIDVAVAA